MKKFYLLVVVAAVTFALLQSVEAYPRAATRSYVSAPHYSAPVYRSAPARQYSAAPRRPAMPFNRSYVATRPRFSATSMALRNPTYTANPRRFAGDRTAAFNSRTFSSGARLTPGTRTAAARSQGFNASRAVARYSASNWHRNWDRGRDHWWRGHRCHFRNGFWFIYDPFPFCPYYGLYSYNAYYGGGYYDDGSYGANDYAANDAPQTEYDGDSQVSDVQSALAREGYYDGAINGKLGPATRNALRRYQRDHGLETTGSINRAVRDALRLR